ncbi:uncharacterized protein NFIA_007450 [Aspergillus fischeri NRRL 181]|uniref:CCHC-type domain-containing protein n=1 Tax=Neosartorya fischeri (strain ATCC 1020 / DSM 3700 / CBS 544.65 / FGSC A1164 / JCM 1740 / NRRL 181 / WB 181) TaxID=331117 RepID=A1D0X6_NEOFI|nr:uncharacterized protein NFIA_007450 [Aspergillus fischeri NRRL 181]EAW22069.1 hypothetical protein NFIA_007450 [Aspergillus fischeri NRRL 181]
MGGKKKKGAVAAANASPWPDLPLDTFNDLDLRAHSTKLLDAVSQLKCTAESTRGLPPFEMFWSLLGTVESLTVKARDGDAAQLAKEVHDIKTMLKDTAKRISSETKSIQHSLDAQRTLPGAPGRTPYRAALLSSKAESSLVSDWMRRAHTNGSIVSGGHTSTGSLPAPVSPQRSDLEIHIRRTDRAVVDPFRHKEGALVEHANRAIQESGEAMIAHRKVSTGRVLPSGDVLLQADSLEDTERLTRSSAWIRAFGADAALKKQTYGVVMHGVDCHQLTDGKTANFIARLKADNAGRLAATPTEIVYAGWLYGQRKVDTEKLRSSLVLVDFDSDRAANRALELGLALDGRNHACAYYDRNFRLQQCYNCQLYGHIAKHCKRTTACPYCAGRHPPTECPDARDREKAKCAVCVAAKQPDDAHFAYDRSCSIRGHKQALIRAERLNGPQFHAPAARWALETPPSSITSTDPAVNPSPAEAAAQTDTTLVDAPLTVPALPPTRPSMRPLTRSMTGQPKARATASRSKSTPRDAHRREPDEPAESVSTGEGKRIRLARQAGRERMDEDARWQHPEGASLLLEHEGMATIAMETPAEQRRRSRFQAKLNPELDLVQSDITPQGNALSSAALTRVSGKSRRRSQRENESDDELSAEVDQFVDANDHDTAEQSSSEGTKL